MAVSYKRLWKLLVDKEMSKSDLRKKAEIAPNTMTKLRRDEEVSLTILSKICKTLNADFGDIVEYVPDAEIWDLYDENRELLGRDHVRGEQLPIDGYHLVVHVWIRNFKGEYLISQRSVNRPTHPLMWECVGGSVVKGEDSLQGAIREAKEEVGVDLNPEKGQVLFTKTRKIIDGKIFNDIMDVWLFEYNGEVDLSNATTDEVAQVTWMNQEQIELVKILLKNTYINFLLGAGTSYNKVEGKMHFPLMWDLLNFIREDTEVLEFYNSLKKDKTIPVGVGIMLASLYDDYLFSADANIEKFLSVLEGVDLYITDIDFRKIVEEQRNHIRMLIRDRLNNSDKDTVINNYISFYNGLKNVKEVNGLKNQIFNIFTTNYDMMNEMAMESQNIHYYSGFEGIVSRKFNLAYYNYDFVDSFQVKHANVKVTPNHMNLFKIHGSLSWCMKDGELIERNPYEQKFLPEIIYPSVDKFKNTNLIISYSALMRELSNRLCQENTTLFVSGMSMSDEHINKIIENALTINTFHMVIFCATAAEIKKLQEKYKAYRNVIVVDREYKFCDVADLMQNLQGGD